MAEDTKIEWCDHTINFWWGCTKVSPACANCYAEGQAARFFPGLWGPNAPRLTRVDAARREALRYERRAVAEGRRFRVFTNSMSDFFEDRRDLILPRLEALETIWMTPHLDWLILTKRPEKVMKLLHQAKIDLEVGRHDPSGHCGEDSPLHLWLTSWTTGVAPANVWLGTTVEDQARADQRIPALLQVPAAVRFLSCEPLLGPVDIRHRMGSLVWTERDRYETTRGIDWVICGGESGPHARPMHPDWARGLRDQCAAAGVPFFFKQWGEWIGAEFDSAKGKVICQKAMEEDGACGRIFWTNPGHPPVKVWGPRDHYWDHACARVGKKAAGRLLDGMEHNGYPEVPDGL